tara:strand:- start:1588 stop:2448 length:861 start_codon:yes stop_codon:yes gene_type:complete
MTVRKAVIPTAGFGTRFLPVTRSIPKNMLPVLDRPSIHLTVEEAAKAGIEHIVFVLTHGQEAIGHYFDRLPELEQRLKARGDSEILEQMVAISDMAEISYVYQKQQLGPGHAVLAAKSAIGHEPFAVFFPDDLILSEVPTIATMIDMFNKYGQSVIAVARVEDETIPSKGIINPQLLQDNIYQVLDLIEKPTIQDAPSNLAIVGRYVLTEDIFDALESLNPTAGGEIWLTDAISELLKTQKVYGYEFPGIQFDVGTPIGLQMASVYEALRREDTSNQFRNWIKNIL